MGVGRYIGSAIDGRGERVRARAGMVWGKGYIGGPLGAQRDLGEGGWQGQSIGEAQKGWGGHGRGVHRGPIGGPGGPGRGETWERGAWGASGKGGVDLREGGT